MSKDTRVFEGWLTRYKINRPLSEPELEGRLDVRMPIHLPPMDSGLIKINSVFVECIERWFFQRGWGAMWGGASNYYVRMLCACIWDYHI